MKPHKYDALEFCRRAIRSCKTKKHCNGAHNLIFNFRRMFPDDLDLSFFIESELYYKRKEVRHEKNNQIQR